MPAADRPSFPGVQIHESAYVDLPCEIGDGTRIWHFCHVMADSRIGRGCSLGQNVLVASGVQIGDNVKIQNNVSVYTGVILEDDVFCGPSMVFTNVINPRSEIPRKDEYRTTVVQRGATLGANCTVLCGTEIGHHAFIGAGAVVSRDVAPYALVIGVPARRAGWMCRCGIRLPTGPRALVCGACGNTYQDDGEGLVAVEERQIG